MTPTILDLAQALRRLWREAKTHEKHIGGTTPELREALFDLLTAEDDTPAPVAPDDVKDELRVIVERARVTPGQVTGFALSDPQVEEELLAWHRRSTAPVAAPPADLVALVQRVQVAFRAEQNARALWSDDGSEESESAYYAAMDARLNAWRALLAFPLPEVPDGK